MADTNIIPSYYASGSYEANNPFNAVVIVGKYYRVEAIRSVREMQSANFNLYQFMFKPAGFAEDDYQSVLDDVVQKNGAILTLIGLDGQRVYVPTTYLKSFPLVDGVSYERLCAVFDLGAVPPSLKTMLTDVFTHCSNYIETHAGVKATVQLGTMPTIGYVTKEQAAVFETTRQNKIKDTVNDIVTIANLEKTNAALSAYIVQLEAALEAAKTNG